MNSSNPQRGNSKSPDPKIPRGSKQFITRDAARGNSDDEWMVAIESSIRKSFAPPVTPELDPSSLPTTKSPQSAWQPGFWKIAACGLLVLTSTYLLLVATGNGPFQPKPFVQTKLTTLYGETLAFGFEPDQVMESADQLSSFVSRQLRTSVSLRDTSDTRFLGTIHLGGISHSTTTLMALVEEKPVLLFFERNSTEYDACITEGTSHLNIFEKRLNDVVAFEVTPHRQPSLLSLVDDSP